MLTPRATATRALDHLLCTPAQQQRQQQKLLKKQQEQQQAESPVWQQAQDSDRPTKRALEHLFGTPTQQKRQQQLVKGQRQEQQKRHQQEEEGGPGGSATASKGFGRPTLSPTAPRGALEHLLGPAFSPLITTKRRPSLEERSSSRRARTTELLLATSDSPGPPEETAAAAGGGGGGLKRFTSRFSCAFSPPVAPSLRSDHARIRSRGLFQLAPVLPLRPPSLNLCLCRSQRCGRMSSRTARAAATTAGESCGDRGRREGDAASRWTRARRVRSL